MSDSARADALRAEVAAHKAAIRRHRQALSIAKAELVSLDTGIRLVVVEKGEGEPTHGRQEGTGT